MKDASTASPYKKQLNVTVVKGFVCAFFPVQMNWATFHIMLLILVARRAHHV